MCQVKDILVRRREYPSGPIVGVGAVVLHAGSVLLVRRANAPLAGEWSLPGGAVELGETLEEAVTREVAEESGLTVVPLMMLKTFDRIEKDPAGRVRFHYVLVDFLCKVIPAGLSKVVQNAAEKETGPAILRAASDASDARWVPWEGLSQPDEFVLPAWTMEVIAKGWTQAWKYGLHLPVS